MKRNTIIQQFLEEALSEDPAINENGEKEEEMSEEWKDDKEEVKSMCKIRTVVLNMGFKIKLHPLDL